MSWIRHCKRSTALVVLLSLMLAGCGGSRDEMLSPGQAEFSNHCAGCHGRQGQGRAPSFPPLAGSEWLELPGEGLAAIVLLGLRGDIEVAGKAYVGYMPPMRHLDDARLARILNYVLDSWGPPGASELEAEQLATLRAAIAGREALRGRAEVQALLEALK